MRTIFHQESSPSAVGEQKELDSTGLAKKLRRSLKGEVRFDPGSRALYATDASNYRQPPIGVVIPRDKEDVLATLATCREYGAPVLSRGAGTSLGGQCCNVAVVLDFTKYMNRVLEVDPGKRLARVEPGCVLDDLRQAASRHSLTFGPDPATHAHCSLGGMLGNNACGIHSLISVNHGLGQRTSDNTQALEVATYSGDKFWVGAADPAELEQITAKAGSKGVIYNKLRELRDRFADPIRSQFPKLPRRVSGYNLEQLLPENQFQVARALVGSEGTCVTILEASLHLVPAPAARVVLLLGYPDVYSASEHLMRILEHKPTGLEGMDRVLYGWLDSQGMQKEGLPLFPEGDGWLLVEFGGESHEAAVEAAKECMRDLEQGSSQPATKLIEADEEKELVWRVRESGLAATAWQPGLPDNWPGFEDSAVPPEKMADYLRELRHLMDRFGYKTSLYGHFGQGCVHCRIPFDLYSKAGVEKYRDFMEAATDLVVRFGGSFSGEHGDGQARGEFLAKMYGGPLMEAFREFKRIWDPDGKMNPGKVIDANPITEQLRLGPDYSPPMVDSHFHFPADDGSFARAALRCVGVGKCRDKEGQTMCPSYMVTMEEQHSTRGRARLLWEMLNGNALKKGWRSPEVHESLDLCLACKGCKSDCPVSVDMATYKAEFLSHYYKGRVRPLHAYAFGLVSLWAQMASLMPGVANFFVRAPGLRTFAKWLVNVDPKRDIPQFAPTPFKTWFRQRPKREHGKSAVILWADTFHNYFHPEVAKAAVEVLEDAGFRVEVPLPALCCGRPLYDYGMLDTAKRWLRQVLAELRPVIRAGLPIVVLEPSCCAIFRDELLNLFPQDLDAQRLSKNTFLLSEFLETKAPDYRIPKLERAAVVHGHCHHKAVMGMEAERAVLKKMGLDFEVLESGCCGMAGAFGYGKGDHYEVSIACGERVLLPEVRHASDESIIITNGFSCREQIRQSTDREALHLAEVLRLGMTGAKQGLPEADSKRARQTEMARANRHAAVAISGVMGASLLLWRVWLKNGR